MDTRPPKTNDWCRACFVALIGCTLASGYLTYAEGHVGYVIRDVYGNWPRRALVVFTAILYGFSIVAVFRNRTIAVMGFISVALVVALLILSGTIRLSGLKIP